MPAKSLLGETREALHHFYATVIRSEVSDANVQAYLRAASQIQEHWQQLDERLATLQSQGMAPWDAYAQLGYPLAFLRSARAYQVFVQQLLAADAAFEPRTVGYLPRLTADQANALCDQMQGTLHEAVASFNNPAYRPTMSLPLVLGPRIETPEQPCPVTHLQGMIEACREIREWAAGLIAEYASVVRRSNRPVPAEMTAHLTALEGRLAQADSQLRFGTDLAGQVSQEHPSQQVHESAEDALWEALQHLFLLNQAVALPRLLSTPLAPTQLSGETDALGMRRSFHDRALRPDDLWRIAAPSARQELRGTPFGEEEMQEMNEKMGGILSAGAQQYLKESEEACARGDAYPVAAMANCPFEPIYRSRRALQIASATVPANYEFHWDFHRGHIEAKPRFQRVSGWQECEE